MSRPASDRPAVEAGERAAKQRRAEEAVLAVPEIDEHGRVADRKEKGEPFDRFASRSADREGADDGENGDQVETAATRPATREGRQVGQLRQGRDDEQKDRRILPSVERGLRPEQRLLAGVSARAGRREHRVLLPARPCRRRRSSRSRYREGRRRRRGYRVPVAARTTITTSVAIDAAKPARRARSSVTQLPLRRESRNAVTRHSGCAGRAISSDLRLGCHRRRFDIASSAVGVA